ncbi:glycosyltransferase involved in cell wall biosynthesis [Cohnella lupini]|uniref:Glycosyltransferase involved in cell wall biosynthesis n=1 Tax=Cohnella lupini TaxID=1294267 RepID=A0A3D9I7G5_9BACL|nr:glycosyltransferase involved in cell wall biosynthesis [Cohnella lupini]
MGLSQLLVSIIIPVYNTEAFVGRAIASAMNQSYLAIEIILINDGSSDRSGDICDEYAVKDSRIKVIHQQNQGVSAARNKGLDEATGSYIQFMDSDDEIDHDMTKWLVQAIAENKSDLVICGYANVSDKIIENRTEERSFTAEQWIFHSYVNPKLAPLSWSSCNMLFKRSIIEEHKLRFETILLMGEDVLFVLSYVRHCQMIYTLNRVLYKYYIFKPDDRVSAISYFSPDLYRFRILHLERMFANLNSELGKEELRHVYQAFMNVLILSLVHMGGYADFFAGRDIVKELSFIVHHPRVIEASKVYKRPRRADSRIIPLLIRWRLPRFLLPYLLSRGRKYIEKNGKRAHVRSIFRGAKTDI